MFQSQIHNFRLAIRKKKARIEEIKLICSEPPRPNVTSGSRRHLIEERLHLEDAVAELEREGQRLEIIEADRNFRWEDVNQQLLSAKTNNIAEEMSKQVSEGKRRIEFEVAQLGNSAVFPSRWFDFMEQIVEEQTQKLYEAYLETWTQQNKTITPSFIRAVRDRALAESFAATKSSVASDILRRARRISSPVNSGVLSTWSMKMDRLATRWNRKLEADAIAAQYRAWDPARGLPSPGSRLEADNPEFENCEEHEPFAPQPIVIGSGSARVKQGPQGIATVEEPAEKKPGNRSLPLAYQSAIKRAILMQLLANHGATGIDICRGLDAAGDVGLPEKWKTPGNDRLFAGAYRRRIIRPRIDVTISKIRADMRKRGLIPQI